MAAEYHFITHWKIRGTVEEVAEVLDDVPGLARWWPSVYLDVRVLESGDPVTRVGRVADLYTKSWLPAPGANGRGAPGDTRAAAARLPVDFAPEECRSPTANPRT